MIPSDDRTQGQQLPTTQLLPPRYRARVNDGQRASTCHTGVDKVTKNQPPYKRSVLVPHENLAIQSFLGCFVLFFNLYKSNAEQSPALYMQVSE